MKDNKKNRAEAAAKAEEKKARAAADPAPEGETPEEAARRELGEETGLRLVAITHVLPQAACDIRRHARVERAVGAAQKIDIVPFIHRPFPLFFKNA